LTRGKHGRAAANRREAAELLTRAEKAEHRAARAEGDLAALREQTTRRLESLRTELAEARKAAEAAAAPALTAAIAQIRTLLKERDEARRQAETCRRERRRSCDRPSGCSAPPG
jgi:hypothetical protein